MEVRHQHSTSMSEKKDIYAIQREAVDQHKQNNKQIELSTQLIFIALIRSI